MIDREALIHKAVGLLREAGVTVIIQGSKPVLTAIVDDINLRWSEPDGCRLTVDGVDITEKIKVMNFGVIPGQPPFLSCRFSRTSEININSLELLMKYRPDNTPAIRVLGKRLSDKE